MEQLWAAPTDPGHQGLTVREVHAALATGRDIAYTTVMTVMDRLARKELVSQEKDGRAYRYRARASRAAMTAELMRETLADFGELRFNTALAGLMEYVNALNHLREEDVAVVRDERFVAAVDELLVLLAPMAPHLAEELWHQLGHSTSVHRDTWPKYDEQYLVQDTVTLAVQINGKLRGTVEVPAGVDEAAAVEQAKADPKIAAHLDDKQLVKAIYVAGKLLNFVVR